jgi:hypothetical protein
MFITSVAYDYYKSFSTAFIEINGQPETIFGKPPTHYIVPIINVLSALEGLCFFTFWVFLLIHVKKYPINNLVNQRRQFIFSYCSTLLLLWTYDRRNDWTHHLLDYYDGKIPLS